MKCQSVHRAMSAYVDGKLAENEWRAVWQHLARCRDCAVAAEQISRLKVSLGAMPQRVPPARLIFALRAMASRELARRRAAAVQGFLGRWTEALRLRLDDLMRPLALPFAGGLISAILVLSVFMPMYGVTEKGPAGDVPTMLSTEARVNSVPNVYLNEDEVVVDLLIDGQGRMVDYAAPRGQDWMQNAQVRRTIENALLFANFTPGTTFGQPASGWIRVTFRRSLSQIDVKG